MQFGAFKGEKQRWGGSVSDDSEVEDDRANWTPEMIEEDRLETLHSPLFDLFLRFERAFCRMVIDRHDISDDDAERVACRMESTQTEGGKAYAYLMRQVKFARMFRVLSHQIEAVQAYEGNDEPRMMRIEEIVSEYAKIPKGDA
jgi:hypothetical protein